MRLGILLFVSTWILPLLAQQKCGILEIVETSGSCIINCGQGKQFDIQLDKCVEIESGIQGSITCENGEEKVFENGEYRCISKIDGCCIANADDFDVRLLDAKDCSCNKKCEDLGDEYKCVEKYQCSDGKVNYLGARSLDSSGCSSNAGNIDLADKTCPGHLTCCKKPKSQAEVRKCQEPGNNFNECGRIANTGTRFISSNKPGQEIDDYAAQVGEFPHMYLFYSKEESPVYRGPASLIGKKFLLTSAHKLYYMKTNKIHDIRKDDLVARCGVLSVNIAQREPNLPTPQDQTVATILLHPEYDPFYLTHNIAIFIVKEPFNFMNHMSPVCLPKPKDQTRSQECYFSGWGSKEYYGSEYNDLLKKIKLPVVDSDSCQTTIQNLPRFKNGKTFVVYDHWICAGGNGVANICKEDGGSPYVCKVNGKWVQYGTVAFGFNCNQTGTPSIISNVAKEMCWIDYVMSCPNSCYNLASVDDLDIRNLSPNCRVPSVNNIQKGDCDTWSNENKNLTNRCTVEYV